MGNDQDDTPRGKTWIELRAERAEADAEHRDIGEGHYRDVFNYASGPIFCVDAETMC